MYFLLSNVILKKCKQNQNLPQNGLKSVPSLIEKDRFYEKLLIIIASLKFITLAKFLTFVIIFDLIIVKALYNNGVFLICDPTELM